MTTQQMPGTSQNKFQKDLNTFEIDLKSQCDPLSYMCMMDAYISINSLRFTYIYIYVYVFIWASQLTQTVKNLPTMQEIQVLSPGLGRSPEEEMAMHSRILAWRISRTEVPGGLQSMGRKELDTTELLTCSFTEL